jgi:protein-S-isoprenylcysteine O-methyltransferase Ste14
MLALLLAYLLLCILFTIEYKFQAKLVTTSLQTAGDDRGSSRQLFVIWFISLVIAPLWILAEITLLPLWLEWAGVVLILFGIGLMVWATQSNTFYLLSMATTDDHYICTDGPYRVVRHPGYCSFLVAFIGFGLATGNVIAFIMIAVLMVYAYILRIQAEEQMMLDRFGVDYQQYMSETYR